MALPPLDDSGVQEGVITSKKKRDDTVQQLNEFDYSQALSLNPVEQDIQTMNIWLTDIEGMFQSGLTDVHFQSSHWGILASRNTLKMELEARTSRIPGDTAVQPNNYDLTTMFSTFLSGASPIQFGYAGFIRKPTVLYGPSILGFASLPTHSTTKNINENVKDESNELDEIYAAILKSNPELAVDNPSTPQTYSANEPITYEGMRKVLGGNGSGTPDGLFAMGVGLSIAAKKGGEIAADEFLLNDIETLRDPNASKTDKGIALFSLTPMGKLKKAAEGIEEGKDLLEHVMEVQKKAEKAKDTAKDAKKSVEDVTGIGKNPNGKITYPSKPHTNKTPGHWEAMVDKAEELAMQDNISKVYLNKGLSNEIPGIRPNRRPDIMVVRKDGKIDQYEVPSKTDNIYDLRKRMIDNQKLLGEKAGDIYILPPK
ncbi:MAG: T7SS effector LXG polymorphic toxin [Psychrobacillus psychrodurans]